VSISSLLRYGGNILTRLIGILLSLSILTAVGLAVYQNPQVQAWVEEQRRKIIEFLQTFGDELDPQSRREAEAFAYQGRLPNQSSRQETAVVAHALARATGRETTDDSISRRNRTSHASQSPQEADERKQLGLAYLAKMNEEKERQKMRRSVSGLSEKTYNSPTFDQLVNADGTLKTDKEQEEFNEKTLNLPSVPTDEPKSARGIPVQIAMAETASVVASRFANPFGDEFELSGTLDSPLSTQTPAVPPKIALQHNQAIRKLSVTQKEPSIIDQLDLVSDQAGFIADQQNIISSNDKDDDDDGFVSNEHDSPPFQLSYEEQLARAMSISLAESEKVNRISRALEQEQHDMDFEAAVAASLVDAEKTLKLDQQTPSPDPPVSVPSTSLDSDSDELYTLSPNLAARDAVLSVPYDPVHEAASSSSSSPTLSSPSSVTASVAASSYFDVESIDSGDESEADGVLTPSSSSWTEVGSEVGSEEDEIVETR
jgi:hypothetical protein